MAKVYTQWTKLDKNDCFIISTVQTALYFHNDNQMKKGIVGSLLFKEKEANDIIIKRKMIDAKVINAKQIIKA